MGVFGVPGAEILAMRRLRNGKVEEIVMLGLWLP
jgi:hypothetical protein